MEGKVEPEVCVAHGGGGHREYTEPQPRVPEDLLAPAIGWVLIITGERFELGVGVEEGCGKDVENVSRLRFDLVGLNPSLMNNDYNDIFKSVCCNNRK